MTTLLPLLFFMLIIISLNIILKKNIVFCIPLSFIFVSLLIMFGGYLGDLRIGLLGTLAIPMMAIYRIIKNHLIKKENLLQYIKENGVVIVLFAIMFILVCRYHSSSYFNAWDEYAHWGPMVKGMFYNNELYTYLNIHDGHPEYPPLFQCIEWLFCYLSRGYSEVSVYRGVSTFSLSLFFPVLLSVGKRNIAEQIKCCLLFCIGVLLLITVRYVYLESFLTWAYLDMPIAILAGSTGYLIIKNSKGNESIIGVFLSAVLLTKEIGIAFYLVLLVLVISFNLIAEKDNYYLKKILFYIVIPLLLLVSWRTYSCGIQTAQFSFGKFDFKELFGVIFKNSGVNYRIITKNEFINALFNTSILETEVVETAFAQTMIVLLLFLWLYLFYFYKCFKKSTSIVVGLFLGTIGYTFVMFVLYMFCFSEHEAVVLASFARYFGSYLHFFITLFVLIMIDDFINKDNKITKLIGYAVIIISLFICNTTFLQQTTHIDDVTDIYDFKMFATQIEKYCEHSDKILIIDWGYRAHIASYYFLEDCIFSDHLIQEAYTKETIKDMYEDKYDYVFIWSLNDPLTQAWNATSNDKAEEGRLYKVVNDRLVMTQY